MSPYRKLKTHIACYVFFLLILPLSKLNAQNKENPPNVIYIMADDLGIGDLSCYGQKRFKTPNIDKLAEKGLLFTQHYAGSTVSAPSRCSLLTGKHTGNAYIRGNKSEICSDGETYDLPLAKNETTIADIFKQEQYTTACIGKWGLGGPDTEGHPNKHGFDYFFGYLGQLHAHRYFPEFLWENNKKIQLNEEKYAHGLIIDKALSFIEKNSEKPFFVYLTPTIPHADLDALKEDIDEFENKFCETPFTHNHYKGQENPKAVFAAMVTRLDKDVKKIMDLLKEKGIVENTIVIFTSDNGTHKEGGHDPDFFDSNGPYRGTKRDMYEGGIRTPFIVNWPAKIKEGRVTYHQSAFWDFMPTMAELIGAKSPNISDGISYLPTILGKDNQKKHSHFYWEFHEEGGKRALLKDNWKLIELSVNRDNKRMELYNLSADPGELSNVATQYPEIVAKMTPILMKEHSHSNFWEFK